MEGRFKSSRPASVTKGGGVLPGLSEALSKNKHTNKTKEKWAVANLESSTWKEEAQGSANQHKSSKSARATETVSEQNQTNRL